MGLLDIFDNPGMLQQLLGSPQDMPSTVGGSAPPQQQQPPQQPPAGVMASADPNFSPSSTLGTGPLSAPQQPNAPPAPPPSWLASTSNPTFSPSSAFDANMVAPSQGFPAAPAAPPQAAPQAPAAQPPMPPAPAPYSTAVNAIDLTAPGQRASLDQESVDRSAGSGNKETDKYIHHYDNVMESAGLTPRHIDAIRQGVSKIESDGNYQAQDRGNSNFGRYQYNMQDVRTVAKDVFGEKPPSYRELMSSPDLQEKYYGGYLSLWDNYLTENSRAYRDASPDRKAQTLAAAQMGAHSKDWVEGGSNFRDANGTHISAWPNMVAQYLGLNGATPPQTVPGRFSGGIPQGAGAGPVTMANGGGLAGALGINPNGLGGRIANNINIPAGMAALGKGLSAVGNMKPGSFGATNFAAGMGGALTGGVEQQNKQQADIRQQQNDRFNQQSQHFKDWVLSEKLDNDTQRANAYSQFMQQGGRGSASARNAWTGSEYDRSMRIEQKLAQMRESRMKDMREGWKMDGAGKEERQADKVAVDKEIDDERVKQENRFGITHDTYKSGEDPEHAFDADKLTPQQRVWMQDGHWYKQKSATGPGEPLPQDGKFQFSKDNKRWRYENGSWYLYRVRDHSKSPPPGVQPQQQPQQQQPSSYQAAQGAEEPGVGT